MQTLTRPLPLPPRTAARRQAVRFLLVGGVATVVDVGVFNVLHFHGGLGPLTAKVASTLVAAVVAFVGNRQWSFAGAAAGGVRRQALAFVAVNAAALLVALLPLAVARYLLGMTGVLELNLATNVVGLGLATALRFWGYRRWVFPSRPAAARAADEDEGAPALAA